MNQSTVMRLFSLLFAILFIVFTIIGDDASLSFNGMMITMVGSFILEKLEDMEVSK